MFACPDCTKTFRTEGGKEMHRKAVHTVVCDLCERSFKSLNAYNQHYVAVHYEVESEPDNETESDTES